MRDLVELNGLPDQHEDATGTIDRNLPSIELFGVFQSALESQGVDFRRLIARTAKKRRGSLIVSYLILERAGQVKSMSDYLGTRI